PRGQRRQAYSWSDRWPCSGIRPFTICREECTRTLHEVKAEALYRVWVKMGMLGRMRSTLRPYNDLLNRHQIGGIHCMSAPRSESLQPTALSKEGKDQLVIRWNDGHRSPYSLRHLRDNCPCAGCREERLKPPDPFRILSANESVPLGINAMTPIGYYAYKI